MNTYVCMHIVCVYAITYTHRHTHTQLPTSMCNPNVCTLMSYNSNPPGTWIILVVPTLTRIPVPLLICNLSLRK